MTDETGDTSERQALTGLLLDALGWDWPIVDDEHIPTPEDAVSDVVDAVLAAGFTRTPAPVDGGGVDVELVRVRHREAYPGAGWCAGCHDAALDEKWPCDVSAALAARAGDDTVAEAVAAERAEWERAVLKSIVETLPSDRLGSIEPDVIPDVLHLVGASMIAARTPLEGSS